MAGVRDLCERWFPRQVVKPRKKWLSEEAWEVVRQVAPARRSMMQAVAARRRVERMMWFALWRLAQFDASERHQAWDRKGREDTLCYCAGAAQGLVNKLHQEAARWSGVVARLQKASRKTVARDRTQHFRQQAEEATQAAADGNNKLLYNITRTLAGIPMQQSGAIKDESDIILTDPAAINRRWSRHFAKVFGAETTTKLETIPDGARIEMEMRARAAENDFQIEVLEVCEIIHKLPKGKGRGQDMVPAEVLQAGGWTFACWLCDILRDCASCAFVPVQWKGGKIVAIWKRKGCSMRCDNHRGILLAPHVAKVLTGAISTRLAGVYTTYVGNEQFGCVKGRGTMTANMMTRALVEAARVLELSCAVLFVDLSKAFDFAIREVLLGWPAEMQGKSREKKSELLMARGLAEKYTTNMIEYIDATGGIIKELGVGPDVHALLTGMHQGAWFRMDGPEADFILTARGGRQGCRLGGLVFNMIYARALRRMRERLAEKGVTNRLAHQATVPF